MKQTLRISVLFSVLLIGVIAISLWFRAGILKWSSDNSFKYYIQAYIADYILTEEQEEDRHMLLDKWIDQAKLVSELRNNVGDIFLSTEDIVGTQHLETASFVYDTGTIIGTDTPTEYEAWMIIFNKFRIYGNYSLTANASASSDLKFCSARYQTLSGEGYDYYIEPANDNQYMIPARKGVASLKSIVFFQTGREKAPEQQRYEVTIEFASQKEVFTEK